MATAWVWALVAASVVVVVANGELSIVGPNTDFILCSAKTPADEGYISFCHGVITCPPYCPHCELSCKACGMVSCSMCSDPGSICEDPKFIGGDGVMFYFHGQKDKDFCIISDDHLHVNAHFIGKSVPGRPRDFTWVKSLALTWGPSGHRLYMGARSVAVWNNRLDHLVIYFDGQPVELPPFQEGDMFSWTSPAGGVVMARTAVTNAVRVEIKGLLAARVSVVPVTQQDSRVHGYGIGADDCFAHLEIAFDWLSLSPEATGVLGQTYVPGYVSPVKTGVSMPVMGGHHLYATSSLFAVDCKVSRYSASSSVASSELGSSSTAADAANRLAMPSSTVKCGSGGATGWGLVCRK